MSTMEKLSSLAGRIRWRSVLALLLFVAVLAVIWKTMPSGFSVVGGVGIRVTADPSSVSPGGSSVLDVEMQNVNAKGDVSVTVNAQTYDRNIYFEDSNSQTYGSSSITVGPQETRKVKLKVKTRPETLEGQYSLDFKATQQGDDKGPETRIALTVEKPA
ncbi:MAG: hypothetical protein V1875_06770 [Candidatus Altiarchaeota archaeon]